MNFVIIKKALGALERLTPCLHENLDTRLGNGTIWGKCEECGKTIDRERLPEIQRRANEYIALCDAFRAEIENAEKEEQLRVLHNVMDQTSIVAEIGKRLPQLLADAAMEVMRGK